MMYIFNHTKFGFCWWDIPALIVLVIVIVHFVWKRHNMVKEEKDLEDALASVYTDDTAGEAGEA